MSGDTVEKGALRYRHQGHPDASVVIPAWNEARHIAKTLASVAKAQARSKKKVEVLIVDNGSDDDTAGIAEHAGAKVVSEPQKGVSYARQRGLEEAEAPVLIGTDCDSEVPEKWIDLHMRHYDDPDVAGVDGGYRFDRVHPVFHGYKACAAVVQSAFRLLRAMGAVEEEHPERGQTGVNFSYRREAALQFGYEPGKNLGEDMILGMKLEEVGRIVRDMSDEMRVTTSGRRYQRTKEIAILAKRKVLLLLKGQLYKRIHTAMDFEDYRD